MKIPTIAFAVILAVLRGYIAVNVPPEHATWLDVYKDVSHVFIGGVGVAYWIQYKEWQAWVFWGLCLLEIGAAVGSRL